MLNQVMQRPIMLIIMDGFGVAPKSQGNAIAMARPSNLIRLWNSSPHTYLKASSEAVGLPANTNGNSEVGHMNIGAGKVIYQNLPRINKAINKGEYFQNATLLSSFEHIRDTNSALHIAICLSDGAVHSHINHLMATIDVIVRNNIQQKVYIHAISDGRDVSPKSFLNYINLLESKIANSPNITIATICGRAYAMDRNENWDRTSKYYDLLVNAQGSHNNDYIQYIDSQYNNNITDEYFEPAVIDKSGFSGIKDNDAFIFLNFRPDRAIQITKAFVDSGFTCFPRKQINNLLFISMVEYQKNLPQNVLYPKEYISLPIGRVISDYGFRQLRIAESEKFPHVTYFLNGGLSIIHQGEDRIEIPSPNVPTYDMKPEMSATAITDAIIDRIQNDYYKFIAVNFANGDMVAHTGNLEATIKSINTVDYCVNKLVANFTARGGVTLITSDHGNAEGLLNLNTGEMDTEHSQNDVPFLICGDKLNIQTLKYGSLCDIAPTILKLAGFSAPDVMTGQALF